jgi:hypothetical protein
MRSPDCVRVPRLVLVMIVAAGCSAHGGNSPAGNDGAGGTGGDQSSGGTRGTGGTHGAGSGGAPAPDAGAPAIDDAAAPDQERVDMGAAADAPAPADVSSADGPRAGDAARGSRHAALIWAYGEHLPTPKPTDPMQPLDVTMKARLEAKGLIVDAIVDATATAAMVMDDALIVVSNSVDRTKLFEGGKPKFRDVHVPALVMKDGVIEVMGMGAGPDGGYSTAVGQTSLTIVKAGDPLAAGLTGNVRVYTTMAGAPCPPCYLHHVQDSDRIIYAFPGAAAKVIGTIVGQPKQAAIFAYDSGAMMVGLTAPAKRMGFFIHRDTDYSPDGLKLFDAAVDYLLAP